MCVCRFVLRDGQLWLGHSQAIMVGLCGLVVGSRSDVCILTMFVGLASTDR